MQKLFVSELAENTTIQTVFLVSNKAVRETRNGDPYMSLTLTDRTGSIEGRAWDNVPALDARFDVDDFVVVRGRVSSYRDQLQITVADIERLPDEQVDIGDYLPRSRWSADALFDQLLTLIDTHVRSPEMRRFLTQLFSCEDRVRRFKTAPAAVSNHHNYVGGLLEHTLSMARVGMGLTHHYDRYYPGQLDSDLVLAGCVLHDFGKCWELSFARSFSYSTSGKLVGHIVQGVELVSTVALEADPPFDPAMLEQLKHLILSHHGRFEYGSPVLPRTPEALLLHEIDMIDSRMNMVHLARTRHLEAGDGAGAWTDYSRLFEGSLYIGQQGDGQWASNTPLDPEKLAGPGLLVEEPVPAAATGDGRGNGSGNGGDGRGNGGANGGANGGDGGGNGRDRQPRPDQGDDPRGMNLSLFND